MPSADQGAGRTARKKATGLRADGTPRRPRAEVTPRRTTPAGGASTGAETPLRSSGAPRGVEAARLAAARRGETGASRGGAPSTGRRAAGATTRAGTAGGTTRGGGTAGATRSAAGTSRGTTVRGISATTSSGGATARGAGGTSRGAGTSARGAGVGQARGASGQVRAPKPVAAGPVRKARPAPATSSVRKPRTEERDPDATVAPGETERLQKVLAAAGIGSRRASEELIAAGRVTVDGRVAQLGDRADAVQSVIYVDGERVVTDTQRAYLAINKPAGVVSTMADEKGRTALADFLGNVPQRVYHVGRLDQESEGLLLLTNDGSLAHKLMHPSYRVLKTYLVEVPGPVRTTVRRRLLDGVELEDGPVEVDAFRVVDTVGGRALVEMVIHEGRKHIVRRLMEEVGHPVFRLIRTAIGPIKLGDLKTGRTRRLTRGEIAALFAAVED